MNDESTNPIASSSHSISNVSVRPSPTSARSSKKGYAQATSVRSWFRLGQAAKIVGLDPKRLRYWDRTGFIQPSVVEDEERLYSFEDLVSLRAAHSLLKKGMPLRAMRAHMDKLRTTLPLEKKPLGALCLEVQGKRLMVQAERQWMDVGTGQLMLNFEATPAAPTSHAALRTPPARTVEARQEAYRCYTEACALDEDENQWDQAEALYVRALKSDPSLANALTNLGNLRYRRGHADEAEEFYHRALRINPHQPEACYNLGFLWYERGNFERAVSYFKLALRSDPEFADAHFNIAMALEEAGLHEEARIHWQAYLGLEPKGPWSDIALRHLKN